MSARVISIFNTKGGVGKTFVGINTAIKLGLSGKRTIFLSFDLKSIPDLSKMINVTCKSTFFDMLGFFQTEENMKALKIEDVVSEYQPGNIHLLPAISDLRQVSQITPAMISKLLGLLRERYDFIIIDAGSMFSPATVSLFDNSSLIVLVVTPDVLAMRQTEGTIDVIQTLHFPISMIKVVLNRAESKGGAPIEEVKMILPSEIIAVIPSEGVIVGPALNKGIPVLLDSPTSRVSRAFEGFGRYLIENDQLYIEFKDINQIRAGHAEEDIAEKKQKSLWESLGLVESIKEVSRQLLEDDEITKLKKRIHEKLVEEMNLKRLPREAFTPDSDKSKELRKKAEHILTNILAREVGGIISSFEERSKLAKDIIEEALGLGPLEDLLKDHVVTEIMVNNKDQIYVEKEGKITLSDRHFTSNEFVKVIIERIITPLGRRIDESVPYVDARLPDGSRVNAIIPPLALTGPSITIRKFAKERLTMDILIDRYKSLEKNMGTFLEAAVRSRKNTIVSGVRVPERRRS